MTISDVSVSEGVESKRRGARYPATSDAAPSPRRRGKRVADQEASPRGGVEHRHSGETAPSSALPTSALGSTNRRRGGGAELPVLVPPIRVMNVAEDPRVNGRVRVRCQALGASVTLVIGASGVRAFNVRTGMVLDTVSWAALSREARVVHAQDAALRMLSTARCSRRDLERRLRKREADPTIVADALGRLDAIGLLNDDEFALAEATAQLRNVARSTGAVKRRLRQRGIDGDVADAAVKAVVEAEEVDDAARCADAAQRRARQLRGCDQATAQRRLVGFLMRRGFSGDLVYAAVRRTLAGWVTVASALHDGDVPDDRDPADGANHD
jgi:regulatory protein